MSTSALVQVGLGVLSGLCALGALVSFLQANRLRSAGVSVTGRVVRHVTQPEGSAVALEVEFDVDGRSYVASGANLVEPGDAPLGSGMEVRYLPSNPGRARIAGSGQLFGGAAALLVVAVIVAGLAVAAGSVLSAT
jgi:hypothetical protein